MGRKIRFYNKNNLLNTDIRNGKFKLVYNIVRDILGSQETGRVYIDEISRSRTEIRIRPVENNFPEQWVEFNSSEIDKINNYVMNLGENRLFLITNWLFDTTGEVGDTEEILNSNRGSYVLKLYQPLPSEIVIKDQLWISKYLTSPIETEIELIDTIEDEIPEQTLVPNFDIDINKISENSVDYKSWDDVLSTNSSTSETLVTTYLSQSSLEGIKLNVDYTSFENYIHFSNARNRIENFHYKMQLMELYTSQSAWYSSVSQSTTAVSESKLTVDYKKNNLLGGLDGFERYLYYNSGSAYSDSYGTHSITPWPKVSSDHPYVNYPTTGSEVISWYSDILDLSDTYDRDNVHQLKYTLPEHVLYDDYNDEYITFLNMVGQYFDVHWLYIKRLEQLYERENDINKGVSNDIIDSVVKSFGVDLVNGKSLDDLWKYSIGSDSTGSYISTGSITDPIRSVPSSDMTYEVWNRILNNLPYLLKAKGTKRGITALLNCYGIPSTILKIREYGGPQISGSNDGYSHYDFQSLNHALIVKSTNYVTSSFYPNSIKPEAIELRFKVTGSGTYSTIEPLLSFNGAESSSLYLLHSGSDKGWLVYEDFSGSLLSSSTALPYFDGTFWNVMIGSGSQFYVYSNQTNGDTINYSAYFSGSMNTQSWESNTSIYITSGSFVGNIQEFRLWSSIPTIHNFNNHSRFIRSINIGSSISSSYDDLITRYSFDDALNHGPAGVSYVSDIKSNQDWLNQGQCVGYSDVTAYPYNYEYYIQDMSATTPIIGIGYNSNKIRIESCSLRANLDPNSSVESGEFKDATRDSNKIGIQYSPVETINMDIIAQYADYNFDDFIGDPGDMWNDKYSGLAIANKNYWGKYDNANNFWDYIQLIKLYDQSLGDIIKKMVPARSSIITGVSIEPHILDRSKIRWHTASIENMSLSATIDETDVYIVTASNADKFAIVSESLYLSASGNSIDKFGIVSESLYLSASGNSIDKFGTISQSNYLSASGNSIDKFGTISQSNYLSASGEYLSYEATLGEFTESVYNGSVYEYYNVIFSSSYSSTINPYWERDAIQGMHYPICNFNNTSSNALSSTGSFTPIYDVYITGSNYPDTPTDVIGDNLIGYRWNHFKYYRDQSTGWNRARYDGCLQTSKTTPNLDKPVQESVNEQNKVTVKDDGLVHLKVE